MNARRRFLGGLTATGVSGWFAAPALAGLHPLPAAAAGTPMHWFVDPRQPVALQVVRRLTRPGEPVHPVSGSIDPDWARTHFQQAIARGASIAGVASMADAFVLGQLASDAGWRVVASQAVPTRGARPALYAWCFMPGPCAQP